MIHRKSKVEVIGSDVQDDTRCRHYHSSLDIIAIRFKCCQKYFPCHLCHSEHADHPAMKWSATELDEYAILCGACGNELTIRSYLNSDSTCLDCGAKFNPSCSLHYDLYFEC